MAQNKDVLTTGEIAKICHVAPRTVSKWFDSGQLRGYRIPGSRDRRVPRDQLIRFMRAHSIPLNGLDGGQTRILLFDPESHLDQLLGDILAREGGYEVRSARNLFEAGAMVATFRPAVMIVDAANSAAAELPRHLRSVPELPTCKTIGLTREGARPSAECGFDDCLARPFETPQIIQKISDLLGVSNVSSHV